MAERSAIPGALWEFVDLLDWVQKVVAVRIQSFMDSKYEEYRSTAVVDEGAKESLVRLKWCRVSYYVLLRDFKESHHGGESVWDAASCLLEADVCSFSDYDTVKDAYS